MISIIKYLNEESDTYANVGGKLIKRGKITISEENPLKTGGVKFVIPHYKPVEPDNNDNIIKGLKSFQKVINTVRENK